MKARIPISRPDPPALYCYACRKWVAMELAEVLRTGLSLWRCPKCLQVGPVADKEA